MDVKERFNWIQITLLIVSIIGSVTTGTWVISRVLSQVGERVAKLEGQVAAQQVQMSTLLTILDNRDTFTREDGNRLEREIIELKRIQNEDPPDWFEDNVKDKLLELKMDFGRLNKQFTSSFNLLGIKIQGFDRRLKNLKEDVEDYYISHLKDRHSIDYKREGNKN